jgi:hypothetical protein
MSGKSINAPTMVDELDGLKQRLGAAEVSGVFVDVEQDDQCPREVDVPAADCCGEVVGHGYSDFGIGCSPASQHSVR